MMITKPAAAHLRAGLNARLLVRVMCALMWASVAYFATSADVRAQSIEYVLMPGKVIAGHADIEVECKRCHIVFEKERQPELCVVCHEDVGTDIGSGTGYHGKVGARNCRDCHTEHKGRDADIIGMDETGFDHRQTDFALTGAHRSAACARCHQADKRYRDAPTQCQTCHVEDDVHRTVLGNNCAECHQTTVWSGATFDHSTTDFELTGVHATTGCTACHAEHQYADTPTTCNGCHAEDDHHDGRFGARCEDCHASESWPATRFDHNRDTRYPLRGKHAGVESCEACHAEPVTPDQPPRTCAACHLEDDAHERRFGNACAHCHTEDDWQESTFDHDVATRFTIEPAHARAQCDACHQTVVDPEAPVRACIACHADDDPHEEALGQNCKKCHLQTEWTQTRFDHAVHTRFKLQHAHARAKCAACHKDPRFRKATSRRCISCHASDDRKRGHRGRFGTRCGTCHSSATWKLRRFNHRRVSGYALSGKHARVACTRCHTGRLYQQKLKRACVSCHRDDDPHAARLGPKCESCHVVRGWNTTTFDHDRARFKLRGAHTKTPCQACHQSTKFKDTPSACVACHADDDAHREGLGPRCQQCHVETRWNAVRFDHAKQANWPLTGKHARVKCARCHAQPQRGQMSTSTQCYDCHRRDDVHRGSLTRRCASCHQSTDWRDVSSAAREWAQQGGPPPG